MRNIDYEIWLDAYIDNKEPPLDDDFDCTDETDGDCMCPKCRRALRDSDGCDDNDYFYDER